MQDGVDAIVEVPVALTVPSERLVPKTVKVVVSPKVSVSEGGVSAVVVLEMTVAVSVAVPELPSK